MRYSRVRGFPKKDFPSETGRKTGSGYAVKRIFQGVFAEELPFTRLL